MFRVRGDAQDLAEDRPEGTDRLGRRRTCDRHRVLPVNSVHSSAEAGRVRAETEFGFERVAEQWKELFSEMMGL